MWSWANMGPRTLVLAACIVGYITASVAQSPTAVAYLNSFNPSDVDRLVDPNSGYTHLLFAFWTARFGPVDAAYVWMNSNLASDPRIKAARATGVKFMVSCGGATEEPQYTMTGTEYGNGAAKFAMDYGFDGIDFDIEGFVAGNSGTGTKWLVDATTEAKRVCPHCIITHAPQAPYFSTGFAANFYDIERQAGSMIDFYNIQFYNQGSTRYESYTSLFEVAEGWSTGTAVREIWNGGIPLSKIVVGKPITKAGVVNSGFVPMDQLASFFQQAKSNGILPRGFMGWQWSLDVNELNAQWARTLGTAWTGSSGSFPIPSSPLPIPSPSPQLPPFIPAPPSPNPVPASSPINGGSGNRRCANTRTVQQGDTIFSIAIQEGKLWEDIYVENQRSLPNPWQLVPGSSLRIPPCITGPPNPEPIRPTPEPVFISPNPVRPDPQPVEGGSGSGSCSSYTVRAGDSLDSIARSRGVTWKDVLNANRDKISDPNVIFVGQVLSVPPCGPAAQPIRQPVQPNPVLPGPELVVPDLQPVDGLGSSTGSCDGAYVGDGTYYYMNGGYTACGERFNDDDLVAAVSFIDFGDAVNPNNSPTCKKCAKVCGPNGSVVVRIKDKCGGCRSGDIDLTVRAFKIVVGDLKIGRQRGVRWNYVDC